MAAPSSATAPLINFGGAIPWEQPTEALNPAPEASQPSIRQVFNVNISEETLKGYAQACEDIQKLGAEQVEMKLAQARSALDATSKHLQQAQGALAKLQEVAADEEEEVQKIVHDDKWYFGKIIIKGKKAHKEKVEDHLETLAKAEEDVAEQEALVEQLTKDKAAQEAQHADLGRKVAQLQHAKQYEVAVVEQCFTGSAGDAKENELENALNATKAQLATMSQFKVAYSSAEKSLSAADKLAKQALGLYTQALKLSTVDVAGNIARPRPGRNSGMGVVVDMRKRQAMQAAVQTMHGAAQMVLDAKKTLPAIPDVDLDRVRGLAGSRGGLVMDVAFDNMISDMRTRRKIQDSLNECQWLAEEIRTALGWTKQWQSGRIDQDLAATQAQCNTQQAALDAYRRECMRKMITVKQLEKVSVQEP